MADCESFVACVFQCLTGKLEIRVNMVSVDKKVSMLLMLAW